MHMHNQGVCIDNSMLLIHFLHFMNIFVLTHAKIVAHILIMKITCTVKDITIV